MRMHLHHFIQNVVDICFPPSLEALTVRTLDSTTLKQLYRPIVRERIWGLSSFSHPQMRALIHEAKFHQNREAYRHLAALLHLFLQDHPTLREAFWFPIPLSQMRLRARGYNQIEEVLRVSTKMNHLKMGVPSLVRMRNTKPQTELGRKERLLNMEGAFVVLKPESIRDKDIVILDDVTTTGATLYAAEKAVQEHNPKSVTLVALSH